MVMNLPLTHRQTIQYALSYLLTLNKGHVYEVLQRAVLSLTTNSASQPLSRQNVLNVLLCKFLAKAKEQIPTLPHPFALKRL